jgi:hypothetical protein
MRRGWPGLALLGTGCLFLSDDDLARRIDGDGDGAVAAALGGDDCDDADAAVHPGAPDAPYDGVDHDCDGADDFDADRDGSRAVEHGGDDCDDADATVGATVIDWHPDCDGDGVGAAQTTPSCGPPVDDACVDGQWLAARPGAPVDCDDGDAAVFPGRVDAPYDGVDADCAGGNDWDADRDGFVVAGADERADADAPGVGDCDDLRPDVFPGAVEVWYDGLDGACDGGDDYDRDGDGVPLGPDCDDLDPSVFPGAVDAPYDGRDADCDGATDWDADRDGFAIVGPPPLDCDDTRSDVFPGAADAWYDALDADCDGANDFDADRDGWVPPEHAAAAGGSAPEVGDCDDTRSDRYPGQVDTAYDGVDADCDDANDWDADRDGYVAAGREAFAGGSAPGVGDCDDADASVSPGRVEVWYDGVDSDCSLGSDFDRDGDGSPAPADCDDGDPARAPALPEVWYDGIDGDCAGGDDFDQDGDGAPIPADCDDTRDDVVPGGPEVWYDGRDGDCDGADDFDADGDGVRAVGHGGADCADFDPAVRPGAVDLPYDDVDADCAGDHDFDQDGDGVVASAWSAYALGLATGDCDDTDALVAPGRPEVWYDGVDADCDGADDFDRDGDGVARPGDCDDGDPATSPDAPEVWYDGRDADCDGSNDYDRDQDGVVAASFPGTEAGTAPAAGDCDDGDPDVSPLATDLPGTDRNCDGLVLVDLDGDGVDDSRDCDDTDPVVWVGGVVDVPAGAPLEALVAAACPGAELVLAPTTFALAGPLRVQVPLTLRGSARLVGSGDQLLDVASGPFLAEGLRLEDGVAASGGCARVAAGTSAVFRDVSFTRCTATGDGGGLAVGSGADVVLEGVTFEDGAADRGGDLFATDATVTLTDLVSTTAAARQGGALWTEGGAVTLTDALLSRSAGAESGGGWWARDVAVDVVGLRSEAATSPSGAAALWLEDTTGTMASVSVSGATSSADFFGTGSVVSVAGGTGTLALEGWVITGTSASRAVQLLEPRGTLAVHDLELGYHTGPYGVWASSESGSGTLTLDNVYVHNHDSSGSGASIWLWSITNTADWALRQVTVTRSPVEWSVFFACHVCGAMEVGGVLSGSALQYGQAAGMMWIDTLGQVDVHDSATLYDRPWLAAYSGPEAFPPLATDCVKTPDAPFVVPLPGVDVHVDPASPLAGAGFWGGPVPPAPR